MSQQPPEELTQELWKQYRKLRSKARRLEVLRTLAENGDQKVAHELRNYPFSDDTLWIAKYVPIADYVDSAIRSFDSNNNEWHAVIDYLGKCGEEIPDQVKAGDLVAVLPTAEYLSYQQNDNEAATCFASLIWFLKDLAVGRVQTSNAARYLMQRIADIDNLHGFQLKEALLACNELSADIAIRQRWRDRCLNWLRHETPAEPSEQPVLETSAAFHLEALGALEPLPNNEESCAISLKFVSSKNGYELLQSIGVLEKCGRDIPIDVVRRSSGDAAVYWGDPSAQAELKEIKRLANSVPTTPSDTPSEAASKDANSHSVFMSYGGPDEKFAAKLNRALAAHKIDTFFFPENAQPGQKLDQVMRRGVNDYDRVVLICSKTSLMRKGLLNELSESLQREAREGGKSCIIPVTLDKFVFEDWAPDRTDLRLALLDRVIADFSDHKRIDVFADGVNRLVRALREQG